METQEYDIAGATISDLNIMRNRIDREIIQRMMNAAIADPSIIRDEIDREIIQDLKKAANSKDQVAID
jgi:hypothetical protein